MQITRVLYTLSLLSLFFCLTASAEQIESMKLLAPGIGWASTSSKLYWTSDNGANWKDITPKLEHKSQSVSSVFFLDSSTGWALLHCEDERSAKADDVCFEFASTNDAGQSWSIRHPKIVDPVGNDSDIEDGLGFSGRTFLDFADPQHGWAIIKKSTHVISSIGEMLRTTDGGKTWSQIQGALPLADHFHFVTPKDGWVAGYAQPESDLYVTHDAGDTWQQVLVRPPSEVKVAGPWPPAETGVWPSYDLPMFENLDRGFLIGSYWDGAASTAVLFSTKDLGRTWKFERALLDLNGVITVFHGTLLTVSTSKHMDKLSFARTPIGQNAASTTTLSAELNSVQHYNLGGTPDAINMVNENQGWLLADVLLTTSDGGANWTDITPGERSHQPAGKPMPTKTHKREGRTGSTAQAASGGNISMHLGLEKQRLPCPMEPTPCNATQSLTAMQAWMNSSPYYDIGLYLPSSPNRGTDTALTPAWVSGAQQQGWGLIPTWFGLQSPCACLKEVKGVCVTRYSHVFSADPSTDGAQEADNAINQAGMLGLATTIIYHDIENYAPSNACSPAVQAFVDGWDSELHLRGYSAGIYANPAPINSDISTADTIPDDIWIAKGGSPKKPQVTIWNQGISDNLWPNSQRIHQFLLDQPRVTFGGIKLASIDDDIDDAQIVPGNGNAVKTASNSYANIDCAGESKTSPQGINDMNGTAFLNASGQTGAVVGYYADLNHFTHGFEYQAGVCSTFDYPGAFSTSAAAINNSGKIVGSWEDYGSKNHGFVLPSGGTIYSIDYPGARDTYLYGINDADQIVGDAFLPGISDDVAFLYYAGNFYPVGPAGGPGSLYVAGINGAATVAGEYYVGALSVFEEYPVPPSWSAPIINIPRSPTYYLSVRSVDNDGELVGSYMDATCGDCGFFLPSDSALPTILQPPPGSTGATFYGGNDFGQAVGDYLLNQPPYNHGFVVTR